MTSLASGYSSFCSAVLALARLSRASVCALRNCVRAHGSMFNVVLPSYVTAGYVL